MRRPPRNGVVLLLVLSLLTLMTIVGVTFALVSSQYRRASRATLRHANDAAGALHSEEVSEIFDEAAMQLLVDTNNELSRIRFHSLLLDMYGNETRSGFVQGAQFTANGSLIEVVTSSVGNTEGELGGRLLTFTSGALRLVTMRIVDHDHFPNNDSFRLMPLSGAPVGVLPNQGDAFIINGAPFDGTGAGFSGGAILLNGQVRVDNLGRLQTTNGIPLQAALVLNWMRTDTSVADPSSVYLAGGVDEDYDAPDFQNVAMAAEIPTAGGLAVLPSFHRPALVNYVVQQLLNNGIDPNAIWRPHGPDGVPNTGDEPPVLDVRLAANVLRRVILRPIPHDHPEFSDNGFLRTITLALGLSQQLDLRSLTSMWDVDNDGDGIRDSVWVDIGLPVRYDSQGRRYKPLVAFKVLDMDGRANLNAHGTLAHVRGYEDNAASPPKVVQSGGHWAWGNANAFPTGMGLGPPEISLFPVLQDQTVYTNVMQARYGADRYPGLPVLPAAPGGPNRNQFDPLSYFKFFRYPLPPGGNSNYYHAAATRSSFSSPYDLRGDFTWGVHRGSGLSYDRYPANSTTDTTSDSPYEMDLVKRAETSSLGLGVDAPFTAVELERLLRTNDADVAELPDRLERLVETTLQSDPERRRMLTTMSFDVPARAPTSAGSPLASVPGASANAALIDLIRQRVGNALDQKYNTPPLLDPRWGNLTPQERATVIDSIVFGFLGDPNSLPNSIRPFVQPRFGLVMPQMFRGVPFDVNYPFGNGRDDNNNGVVDEVGVQFLDGLEEHLNAVLGFPGDFDQDNVTDAATNDHSVHLVRQHYARQIYVLAVLVVGDNVIDFDGDPSNDSLVETRYGLAQWAINIVDFRDADSIMTPFEFDLDPWNGWDVNGHPSRPNGIPANQPPSPPNAVWDIPPDVDRVTIGSTDYTERGVVWGMERPEILVTEGVAFHDLRLEDTSVDGRVTDAMNPDEDLDQRLRPRGFAYLELFNPWTGDERAPAELYRAAGGTSGVDLSRRAPGGAPVWRIVFRKIHPTPPTVPMDRWNAVGVTPGTPPFFYLTTDQVRPRPQPWRSLYFVPPGSLPAGLAATSGEVFYPAVNGNWLLPGGHYAVVGSSGQTLDENGQAIDLDGDSQPEFLGPVGRHNPAHTPPDYADTRCFVLEPGDNWAAVINNETIEPAQAELQPILAVPFAFPQADPEQPQRWFNLSEPVGGYSQDQFTSSNPGPNGEQWDAAAEFYEGAWSAPFDVPFDRTQNPDVWNLTASGNLLYVRAYLQRLANPLEPWHENAGDSSQSLNPYITVDMLDVPLYVFNGISNEQGGTEPVPAAPNFFVSRQRGENQGRAGQDETLWFHDVSAADPLAGGLGPLATQHFFNQKLRHSIGYLNEDYENRYGRVLAGVIRGMPRDEPFPHLPWPNRPFISDYELMMVPYTSAYHFARRYAYNRDVSYQSAPSAGAVAAYGHVLNFFNTDNGGVAQPTELFRIFEHLHVPSRFLGTETWLNPQRFNAASNGGRLLPGTEGYNVPFHFVSAFRDPGKVNLNTIYHNDVFLSLFTSRDNATFSHPNWSEFTRSRKGNASGPTVLVSSLPTLFGNPFRGPAGRLVPLPNMRRRDIDTTLMRQTSPNPSNTGTTRPLFDRYPNDLARNGRRHMDFRYQSYVRLANLTTTRSNVYAVWMTLGRFSVRETESTAGNPDGYQIGAELGSDTGEIRRHRAFYLIDRTRPVGFAPGQRLNADRCILIRRVLE